MPEKSLTKGEASKLGLPAYFDMQASVGHTKHIGGWPSTQEIAEMCHLGVGQDLLYVGSGSGLAAIKIAETNDCHVTGVDLLPEMVDAARNWAASKGVSDKVVFKVGDAQELPFPSDRFDVVLCESVNTFVPDLAQAMREYVRVAKPGGFVALNEAIWYQDPSEKGERLMRELTGQRLRRPEEWLRALEKAGVKEIQTKSYPVDMRAESRSQLGLLSTGELLRILWRSVRSLLTDPNTRELVKLASQEPREAYDYMGYGLFVGRVPA